MSVKGKPLWSGFFLFRLKKSLIFTKPYEYFFVHCCQNKVPRDTSDPRSSPSCIFSSLPRIITIPERKSFPKIRADTSDPRSSLSWKFSALLWIIINSQWTSSQRSVRIRPIRGAGLPFVRAGFPSADSALINKVYPEAVDEASACSCPCMIPLFRLFCGSEILDFRFSLHEIASNPYRPFVKILCFVIFFSSFIA